MSKEISMENNDFTEILSLISKAQSRALASVNREMITMYWEIGRIVSEKQPQTDRERVLSLLLQFFSNRRCLIQVVFQIKISGE